MSASRRVFASATRLRIASARSIAPSLRFYSAESAPAANSTPDTPVTSAPVTSAPATPASATPTPAPATPAPATPAPATPAPATPAPATPAPATPAPATPASAGPAPAKPAKTTTANKSPAPAAATAYKPNTAFKAKAPTTPKPNTKAASPYKPTSPAKFEWTPKHAPGFKFPNNRDREIDWATSFYGLGTSPVSETQFKILTKALDPIDIEVKPDGIIYLPEIKYRRKLNEAFGPMGWGIVPRGETVVGKEVVTREYALIINGFFVSQALGVNNYFSTESIPQAVEGAKSNALMRCCKDLGIASELWDPAFIRWFNEKFITSKWIEHVNTKKKRLHYHKVGEPPNVSYPYKLS
ncbi:mitochondrial genome maintenance MGM101-domain-containing protein [Thelonectria olida]|uniref:Mitochondrial genome maintenance protein MGM101 n=1 Tax=Thelonectria olida TaxID=1576542 RepID=A0A9P8WBF0_9HYPO|nr:mitochondrial genome maintenance MGM101-domain-containing protein [Thelonectria olida]